MVLRIRVHGVPDLDVSGSAEPVAENQTMTVKAILKEDNLRMEKFATVMAIYLILFRGDIDNLPFKSGYGCAYDHICYDLPGYVPMGSEHRS